MNLDLTPEQEMIREAAVGFLTERAGPAVLRRAAETGSGYDRALWEAIGRELGWCALAVPEDYGGMSMGAFDMALLAERMGQALLASPFFATVCLAAPLLVHAGTAVAKETYLPAIAAGELQATVGLSALGGVWWPDAEDVARGVTARPDGAGFRLDGRLPHVPDGATAGLILVPARIEGGRIGVFAVTPAASGLTVLPLKTIDVGRPLADLRLDGVVVGGEALVSDPVLVAAGLARALDEAALALAAEQVGVAQGALDGTLAYIAERVQFGRAIASFQAIKHRCAELMVRIEVARSAVMGAAQLAASGTDPQAAALEISAARALATEAAFLAAQEAIQLHGGVGFTWEYDPHLYFKRAQASGAWLGGADDHLDRIAAVVCPA